MESVSCNLCGAQHASTLYTLYDYRLNRPGTLFHLVQCQECGLVYQNPRPTLDELEVHYPDEYAPYQPSRPPEQAHGGLAQQAIQYGMAKRCGFVTRFQPHGGRLLEVGCARGQFLQAMRHIPGWQVQGVEINPSVAQMARQAYGLDITAGTLEEVAFPDQSFDAIALWDVLEHLGDPRASLQEIRRILRPAGSLVLRVPNLSSWDARLFGRYWAGLDAPRHLYVFSRTTLKRLLYDTGFEVLAESCQMGSYASFVISVQFWLTGIQAHRATRSQVEKLLHTPLASLAAAPLFYLIGKAKKGPQVTVVARPGVR